MMVTLTAEQAKQDYVDKMGEPLGAQFAELWQEVADLHEKWLEFVELFGAKESRIDLINRAAPRFFRIVQDLLWEETLLHIARLTDKQNNHPTKRRLTLRNLSQLVKDPTAKRSAEALFAKVERDAEFCRDWRDRHIAHLNLALAIDDPSAQPLLPASRKQVDQVLDGIVALLNAVSSHYKDSESFFRLGASAGGAVSLLYIIDAGLKAQEARRQRLHQGKYTNDDIGPKDI
jgi:AbiU2